ncbi:MAG TPA: hypothetical protein VGA22_12280 [Gemmatimonadales bacterium]
MATTDPVGTALAAIGAGATTGAVVLTAGVLMLRVLQQHPDGLAEATGGALLTGSMVGGVFGAIVSGWGRTRAIDDYWRRGVTAAVSVLGAALLGVAATAVDQFAGWIGLAVYLVMLLAGSVYTHLRAARNAAR